MKTKLGRNPFGAQQAAHKTSPKEEAERTHASNGAGRAKPSAAKTSTSRNSAAKKSAPKKPRRGPRNDTPEGLWKELVGYWIPRAKACACIRALMFISEKFA